MAHRQTARQLIEIFAKDNQREILFQLAQALRAVHLIGIGAHLCQRFQIGSRPSAAMAAKLVHAFGGGALQGGAQRRQRATGFGQARQQVEGLDCIYHHGDRLSVFKAKAR